MNQPGTRGGLVITLWGLGYVVIGAVIATAIAWPVYETFRVVVIAVVGTALGMGIVLGTRRLRMPVWAIILVSIVVFVLAVVPLAVPSALGSLTQVLAGVRDGVAGVVVGWKQLLTLSLPLGEYQAVLVPFLVVVFAGSVIATALVTRGGRFVSAAAPVVIAMSAFGLVFGSSNASPSLVIGGLVIPGAREVLLGTALVLLSLIWLIGRARLSRAQALRAARAKTGTVRQRGESFALAARRNALAVIIVAVALAAGVAVTPVAADLGPRHALRDGIDPLLVVREQPSPLSGYRRWFEAANYDSELFAVDGDTTGVDRIRLATLDSYDGEDFHVSGASDDESSRFSRLPRTEPTSGNPVELSITIGDGYSGIWVPVPNGLAAAPTFVGPRAAALADSFYVSDTSSSAIDVAGESTVTPGLSSGDSYRVYAMPTATDESDLGSDAGGNSLLADVDYPALAQWVKLQQVPRTGEGLSQLIDRLRARGYVSHSLDEADGAEPWVDALETRAPFVFQASYSGHSRARIESMFTTLVTQERTVGAETDDNALVSAVGDDEQFATAGALLARYWGFDSRVVVGVRLSSDDPDLAVAPCDSVCTGSNVAAWIEVRRPGGPWVTFDTSPQFLVTPSAIANGTDLPENPTMPEEVHSEVVDPPEADRGDTDVTDTRTTDGSSWLDSVLPIVRPIGLSLLAILLLFLPVMVLGFAKGSRRRQRRGARVPEVSVVGAWDELVDTYVDYGVRMPRAATRREFAEATARPGAIALATAVDRAVFAEHPPGRDASSASWQLLDEERAELENSSTFGQRLKARFNPASFLRQLDPDSTVAAALSVFRRKESVR